MRDFSRRGCVAVVLLLVVLAAAPSRADGPAPPTLASVLEDVATLAPGPGFAVKDRSVETGRIKITLQQGTIWPVLTKSGEAVGFVFEGEGALAYRSDDQVDRAAFRTNTKRFGKEVDADGSLRDIFKEMFAVYTSPDLEPLFKVDPSAAAGGAPPEIANAVLGRVADRGAAFPHRLAQARLNGGGRFVYAEFEGGVKPLGWRYDELLTERESLLLFRTFSSFKVRVPSEMSDQPVLGRSPAAVPWLRLEDAALDVATPDNKAGTITSDLTFMVRRRGTRLIPLELFNHRDPETYTWYSDKRKLEVKRVVDAAGHELSFSHRYDEIVVEIPPFDASDGKLALHFETGGDVFLDSTDRHGDNFFDFGGASTPRWFPTPTGWQGARFTYRIKVRCKKPWRPITSGKDGPVLEDGDFNVVEAKSDRPSRLVAVFAGKYVTREEVVDGVTVKIHAYAMARKDVLEKFPKIAGGMIQFFAARLGPFPAEELDIVEVPEYGFGVAPAGMVLLTTEAYQPRRDDEAEIFTRGINARLAHEIAHQWFGHQAAPASQEENWLQESFAEYFSGIAMAAADPGQKKVEGFETMLKHWRAQSDVCDNEASIRAANNLSDETGHRDRVCLLYNRGPLVVHMLHTMVGNDRFFKAMSAFLKKADRGPATTAMLAAATSETVGMDMGWFFEDWASKPGIPAIEVKWQVADAGGRAALRGTITQPAGDAFRRIVVPFLVDYGGGRTEAKIVLQDTPVKPFDIPLAATPKTVKVDPWENNLAVYR